MDKVEDYIASNPTGRSTIVNNTVKKNNIQNNIKTQQQASSDINNKINNNEYVCNKDKENFKIIMIQKIII